MKNVKGQNGSVLVAVTILVLGVGTLLIQGCGLFGSEDSVPPLRLVVTFRVEMSKAAIDSFAAENGLTLVTKAYKSKGDEFDKFIFLIDRSVVPRNVTAEMLAERLEADYPNLVERVTVDHATVRLE